MANNWRFFQDTGLVGGTANLANRVFYVDSYNGSDSNVGSNVAPFKTIQKALDSCTGLSLSGADFIIAGYFKEGDFLNRRDRISIIAEGDVTIDGESNTDFNAGNTVNYTSLRLNITSYTGALQFRNYGRLTFINFNGKIKSGASYNCVFKNCLSVHETLSFGSYTETLRKCVFINSAFGGTTYTECYLGTGIIEKNTFINSSIHFRNAGSVDQRYIFRSNYVDTTSTIKFTEVGIANLHLLKIEYNLIRGTLTNKLNFGGAFYSDIEALKLVHPTVDLNGLPSSTNPLFNLGNTEDYTLQELSTLAKAAHDKKHIGAHNVAKFLDTSDSGLFTYTDVLATAGEVKLDNSPTGTLESTAGIELFPKKRLLERISLPLAEINRAIGEVIGSNLASANKPYLSDVEIKYSVDDITYNSTWLRVPINTQPFHDTTNDVGNDDSLFSIGSAVGIVCRYIKLRITLRDNEQLI